MTELTIGKTDGGIETKLLSKMANRHGLIAGATGTGKSVTLRLLAEAFSNIGVPVFTADVKGDLAGMVQAGSGDKKVQERIEKLSIKNFTPAANPVTFWDVYAEAGIALRTTISDFGPILLSRLFDLNDTQEGAITVAFKVADDQGLPILDLKDLRAVLTWIGDNSGEVQLRYGNVAKATIGAIQRDLLQIEQAGGDKFFGEPAIDLSDIVRLDHSGKGMINILDATKLINEPRLYTTFLLWLLSELFEEFPEVGDLDKPKLVFFFDEAHLLFSSAPKALLEKIEQLVRLIRSKGIGIFFVTQNPLDIPDTVLGQLGNRVQHALRAFTPRDQKTVRAAADTFRENGDLDVAEIITQLAVGEALVSCLDEKGVPHPVEKVWVYPPQSRLGAISPDERRSAIQASSFFNRYSKSVDRDSAYEILLRKLKGGTDEQEQEEKMVANAPAPAGSKRQGFLEAFFKSAVRSVGSQLGNAIMRGVFGSRRR